jgi:deazaflavin-dependent oxidoreductase (nitroreductase family)
MPDPTPPTAPRRPFGRSVIARNAWLVPVITRVHRWLYQRLDGRLVAHAGRTQMLLLTTVGRRSGEPRVTPLLYVEDGANLIVVASNGGTERVPAWWLNLQAQSAGRVQCGRERAAITGREASAEETARLWPKLSAAYEFFDDYQARTQRTIPVVILERVS